MSHQGTSLYVTALHGHEVEREWRKKPHDRRSRNLETALHFLYLFFVIPAASGPTVNHGPRAVRVTERKDIVLPSRGSFYPMVLSLPRWSLTTNSRILFYVSSFSYTIILEFGTFGQPVLGSSVISWLIIELMSRQVCPKHYPVLSVSPREGVTRLLLENL